jgi:hypothetical protein
MTSKTLQEKFINGDKLGLIDNLKINLLRMTSDCDGMCGSYQICGYCEIYKSNYNNSNKKENKN